MPITRDRAGISHARAPLTVLRYVLRSGFLFSQRAETQRALQSPRPLFAQHKVRRYDS